MNVQNTAVSWRALSSRREDLVRRRSIQGINFGIGIVVVLPGVLPSVPSAEILRGIERHRHGDWGEVREPDRLANVRALDEGTELLSLFRTAAGKGLWIATDVKFGLTTVWVVE